MSKQDIEKRLGFAAQGVKETTRPGAKAEMGFLSRVGYAATALTADPADPKSPEYRKQVAEAKAAAKDAITNYKFMRDKVKERLAALDAYVTNAIKVINSATSAKDIEHYVEQLRIAVKSQSMILGASKSPFARPGAKATFDTKVGSKGNKSAMIARNGADVDASWLAWVVQDSGDGSTDVIGTMRSYSTEARAKAAALRGLETSGLRGGFARPGAKAKA